MLNALLVVAHPDDDAIFAGPLQIAQSWIKWQAVSVTHASGDLRAKEMRQWQNHLGCRQPLFLGFPDDPEDLKRNRSSFHANDVSSAICKLGLDADFVVTHDLGGEYGHPHHISTAFAVRQAFGYLPLISFAHYRRDEDFRIEVPDFGRQAEEIYPSQRRVIRHLNKRIKCCRIGKYKTENIKTTWLN